MEYAGEEVAVEVCLLHDRKGWDKTREIAFRKEVEKLMAEEGIVKLTLSERAYCVELTSFALIGRHRLPPARR